MNEPGRNESPNQYERPNQPWVCGLAAAGHACAASPTARGHCPALAECAPIRDGDRWQCNRSELRGGPCDEGPTPEGRCGRIQKCRPERSLRSKRRRFIAACGLVAVAAVMITLCSGWRERATRPGPLAQQHAQLLENSNGNSQSCGACHSAATQNVAGWAVSLVVANESLPTQSQLCMNCHSKSISKDLALVAHNAAPQTLQELTGHRRETKAGTTESVNSPAVSAGRVRQVSTGNANLYDAPPRDGSALFASSETQLACATCHREHHGAKANLTTIDNDACQACHEQRYRSFAADHPDFGVWPYVRRTRIAFNHASHRGKHFAEKKQPFDCRTCHAADAAGAVERTASYDTTCASCHDEKIATSVGGGVPMFVLPIMDVDALKAAGHGIGPWPEAAIGDFDGRLPPAMKLLLAGDPNGAAALQALGADFEFQDVDPDDKEQLAASAKLAAAIKSLVRDLCTRMPAAVRERLSTALGRDVSNAEAAMLTAGLSPDTMRVAASWLQEPANAAIASSPISPLTKMTAPYGPAGSWSQDATTFTIRYRPAVHADPVLAAWIELLANTPHVEQRPVAIVLLKYLTKTTAQGLCASCHSVERNGTNSLAVNWRAHDRTSAPRGFTKFTHEPHLTLPQLADCTSCHVVNDGAIAATAYVDAEPQHFVCDFKAVTKRHCADCHTHTAAGDACQSCHNYHVEAVEEWRLAAPADNTAQPEERQRMSKFVRRVGTAHQ